MKFKRFFRDEHAQSTFEYILMLSIAVILAVMVIKAFIQPIMVLVSDRVNGVIKTKFFTPKNMHQIRVR